MTGFFLLEKQRLEEEEESPEKGGGGIIPSSGKSNGFATGRRREKVQVGEGGRKVSVEDDFGAGG